MFPVTAPVLDPFNSSGVSSYGFLVTESLESMGPRGPSQGGVILPDRIPILVAGWRPHPDHRLTRLCGGSNLCRKPLPR